MTMYVN